MTNKNVPFGYRKNEDGEIVESAHQQRAMQLIQSLRDKGYSLAAIKKCLEEDGILPLEEGQEK